MQSPDNFGDGLQSDALCAHCCDAVVEFREPIQFEEDTSPRVREIRDILSSLPV